jgi:hypothetical protein
VLLDSGEQLPNCIFAGARDVIITFDHVLVSSLHTMRRGVLPMRCVAIWFTRPNAMQCGVGLCDVEPHHHHSIACCAMV